jgi:hypothetical protein
MITGSHKLVVLRGFRRFLAIRIARIRKVAVQIIDILLFPKSAHKICNAEFEQFWRQYTYLQKTDLLPEVFSISLSRKITTGWASVVCR